MPFIRQQQESIPPAIIVQRFCNMAAATLSSQAHVTLMPPAHFAKDIVQRGTIIMFMPGAVGAWAPIVPVDPDIGIPDIGIPERSISFVVAIFVSSVMRASCCHTPSSSRTPTF
jgi:hypothetical protein